MCLTDRANGAEKPLGERHEFAVSRLGLSYGHVQEPWRSRIASFQKLKPTDGFSTHSERLEFGIFYSPYTDTGERSRQ